MVIEANTIKLVVVQGKRLATTEFCNAFMLPQLRKSRMKSTKHNIKLAFTAATAKANSAIQVWRVNAPQESRLA